MESKGWPISGIALAALIATACAPGTDRALKGEACDGSTGVYQCAAGLVCAHDGRCQDPGSGDRGSAAAGEACSRSDDCLLGLVCALDDTCTPAGVAAAGEPCGASEHCRYGLICGSTGLCAAPGDGAAGDACVGGEQCGRELVCAGDGRCRDPEDPQASGVAGPGEACAATADCRLGLVCFPDATCRAPELWPGLDCSASEADATDAAVPFKAYFEVPRDEAPGEFYRLPFPNDIRLDDSGHVDLSGHPAPATPLAGGLVAGYIDAIQREMTGFSTQGTVYVRFSKQLDYETLVLSGAGKSFYLVDISPQSPGYGRGVSFFMYATSARGKYICRNWAALKPMDGLPLRHATTYALIVTDGVRSADGERLERDADFETMLAAERPQAAALGRAWERYQPLRDYLADGGQVEPGYGDRVMAAAVFTTMDPDALLAPFRDKLRDCSGADCDLLPEPHPALSLESEADSHYLLAGTLQVPVFQAGAAPYLTSGGQVEFDAQGRPIIQRAEQVALRLSLPKGDPPAAGWPVVVYAHGTGGSARSFADRGVAAALAELQVDLGGGPQAVKAAVLGIEAVQHGDRRGGSEQGPDVLYFNFLNPTAAKYNAVQGAADNFQLVRAIEALHAAPAEVAGLDRPIKLDPNHIVYFGHSQGCLTGPLFLAYEPLVRSAVLSGAGGDLIRSLLTKTQPLDIAGLTRLMLSDRDVGPMHPMLNLLQLYFDPIDVVNYGRALTFEPLPVGQTDDEPPEPILAGPNNVFMSYGRDDHYSTERTMIAFARSLGVHQLEPGSDCACLDECDAVDAAGLHRSACRIDGLLTTAAPVRANAWAAGADFTAVLKLYLPAGEDGHQVLFEPGQGPQDYRGFIGSAIADPEGIPTLFGAGQ